MHSIFGIDPSDVLHISAKTGEGISAVLRAIVERIPPPLGESTGKFKAFLFDSSSVPCTFEANQYYLRSRRYDRYRGVISLVSIQDGVLRKGTNIPITRMGQIYIFQRGQNSIFPYSKKVRNHRIGHHASRGSSDHPTASGTGWLHCLQHEAIIRG